MTVKLPTEFNEAAVINPLELIVVELRAAVEVAANDVIPAMVSDPAPVVLPVAAATVNLAGDPTFKSPVNVVAPNNPDASRLICPALLVILIDPPDDVRDPAPDTIMKVESVYDFVVR